MDKLEQLRNHVAELFGAATDKTTIEKCAIINHEIDEIKEEQTKLSSDYTALLTDYKDAVLHTSFKSSQSAEAKTGVPGSFDPNATFDQIFLNTQDGE